MGDQDAAIFTTRHHFHCNACGNPRTLVSRCCAHCGSEEPPHCNVNYLLVNLELQHPTSEQALTYLDQHIHAALLVGLKILLVLHGYGSSGMGGKIRQLVRQELHANRWADCVRDFIACEALKNRAELARRLPLPEPQLDALIAQGVLNNSGCTMLLMYRSRLLRSADGG